MDISDDVKWTLVAAGSAAVAAWVARGGATAAWRLVRGEDPPRNPVHSDVSWRDALLWTGGAAALAGMARLLGRRGAASVWERVRGEAPPT